MALRRTLAAAATVWSNPRASRAVFARGLAGSVEKFKEGPPVQSKRPAYVDGVDTPHTAKWMVRYYTLVPIRPRSRGERRSLRTFAVVSLRPSLAFNPRLKSAARLDHRASRRRPRARVRDRARAAAPHATTVLNPEP